MELSRFIRPWRTWLAISENVYSYMSKCRMISPSESQWQRRCCQGHFTDKHTRSSRATVTWAWLNVILQCMMWKVTETIFYLYISGQISHMSYSSNRRQHGQLCSTQRSCLPLFKSNTIQQCYSMQIVSCIKQGRDKYSKDCNTAGDVHRWLTVFQNRGCSMENSAGIYCFHGKADPDSSLSQIANMQHTRRCTRHRGVLMPECPSQWGCPVKSLGMSALLCFYTQVERWIWS